MPIATLPAPHTKSRVRRKLYGMLKSPVERILSLTALNREYDKFIAIYQETNFFESVLEHLKIKVCVTKEDLQKIPDSGPLVAVANHPFGGVDGIALGAILSSVRPDAKLMANLMLQKIPELKPWIVPVDIFNNENAKQKNLASMRFMLKHLKDQGALGAFPAGAVSHFRFNSISITDPPWHRHIAKLIRKTNATVIPVFFEGRNSSLFQILGMAHPLIRSVLLPHEFIKKTGATIRARIGNPITCSRMEKYQSNWALVDFLRLNTYILKNRAEKAESPPVRTIQETVIPPVDKNLLIQDVDQLSKETLLIEKGDFSVYAAWAPQIPNVLSEINRLREITFREAGEGTGYSRDLDGFDCHYLHMFMWNRVKQEVVGAYRLGLTDRILQEQNERGLYTSTLFNFKPSFFKQIGPAIELGRSFIRAEYQRKHIALSLIWSGIGRFVVKHPKYKVLFGPVSISHEYNTISKNLMVKFLKEKKSNKKLKAYVKAKTPPLQKRIRGLDLSLLKDIEDVSALVSEIERDSKGAPILLKKYLKLNGALLSFNVDRNFSSVIDGLILVDLEQTPQAMLKRFMGRDLPNWTKKTKAESIAHKNLTIDC